MATSKNKASPDKRVSSAARLRKTQHSAPAALGLLNSIFFKALEEMSSKSLSCFFVSVFVCFEFLFFVFVFIFCSWFS